MSCVSHLVEEAGRYAGHALSIGDRYVFHTQRSDLEELDGQLFNTLREVRKAVDASIDAERILLSKN